jgi:hypothetical protein
MKNPILLQFQEIFQGSFPEWIWKNHPSEVRDHIPVFKYHTVQPEDLENQLRFLKHNDYQSITADTFYEQITQQRENRKKMVLLTFDDGRRSLWSVAFPLLKKYEMKAVAFLIPSIVNEKGTIFPNLEDVWKGKSKTETVLDSDVSKSPTLTWKEIQIMHRSGIVDFQCHTLSHQRIPVSPRISGFVTPEMVKIHYFRFFIPFHFGVLPGKSDPTGCLGAPVYVNSPALSGRVMLKEDPELYKECTEYVRTHGGPEYFKNKNWRKDLWNIVHKYRKSLSKSRFESQDELNERMRFLMTEAKKEIEKHLPGHTVRHLAYPW